MAIEFVSTGEDQRPAEVGRIKGAQRRRLVPGPVKLLQIVTGYLVLRWFAVLCGRYIFGYKVESTLSYDGTNLRFVSTTFLMGREIRFTDEKLFARNLVSVGMERELPQLPLLVGALGVMIGAMVGINWMIDGILASYVPIAIVGMGVLSLGILLDIGMGVIADRIGNRWSILIGVSRAEGALGAVLGRRFRIVGVKPEEAKVFLEALAR